MLKKCVGLGGMDARELRVGNLVDSEYDGIVPVSVKLLERIIDEVEGVSPIPLTEEWLERFGFERGASETMSAYYHKKVGIDDLCLRFMRQTPSIYFCKGNEENSSYEPKYYVHQLQNLYFALTGKELPIPEKASA